MPNLRKIPFAISSGASYSHKNNDTDLVNMFPHMEEAGSKSNHVLLNTAGTILVATAPDDILGIYEFLGVVYVVTKSRLYSVTNGVLTELGTVELNDKVIFADNGIEMIFVASNGYFFNPATLTLGNMEQTGWFAAATVTYMDGYFIFNRTGTGQFFITQLFSHVIDPIDWATGEAAPDDTVAVIVASRQLWVIGERTTEVWYDSGDPDFPFTRISGSITDIGCSNYRTVTNIRSNVFFVGEDFQVYMTEGYLPKRISTSSVEFQITRSDISKLTAFSYTEEGHWFYCISIDDNLTYVYDIGTAQWHRRASGELGRWKIQGAFNLLNTHRPFGFNGTKLYELSIEYLTEDGVPIKREAVTLPLNDTVNRFRLHEVQLDMEVGFDTVNALVSLTASRDGGKTWSNVHQSSTGKIGKFETRVRWQRLGQFRDCILKVIITQAIPIRIIGLHVRTS